MCEGIQPSALEVPLYAVWRHHLWWLLPVCDSIRDLWVTWSCEEGGEGMVAGFVGSDKPVWLVLLIRLSSPDPLLKDCPDYSTLTRSCQQPKKHSLLGDEEEDMRICGSCLDRMSRSVTWPMHGLVTWSACGLFTWPARVGHMTYTCICTVLCVYLQSITTYDIKGEIFAYS